MPHSKEPWKKHPTLVGMVVGPDGEWLAHSPKGNTEATAYQADADARRIVAAINAVAGIPDAALEQGVVADLLAACEAFRKSAALALEHWDADRDAKVGKILLAMCGRLQGYLGELDKAHAALAKAKGAQP